MTISTTSTTVLRLGFAAAIFSFATAADCDGGDVNLDNGTCPTGETCSPDAPDGLVFVAPVFGEGLFDTGEVKDMATGGTQHIQVEIDAGSAIVPFTDAFVAGTSSTSETIAGKQGNTLELRAGSADGWAFLRITDPANGELFDRIAVNTTPAGSAQLIASFNETISDAPVGTPMLFSPGGIGFVELQSAADDRLIDDSMQLTGAGITQASWDQFSIGDLAAGTHQLVATSAGHAFTIAFEVAAGPDRLALSSFGPSGSDVVVGAPTVTCFSAFVGTRYLHAGWTFSADNADLSPSKFEGCIGVTPRAPGAAVVHAFAGGLSIDDPMTATAAPTTARRAERGSPGERKQRLIAR